MMGPENGKGAKCIVFLTSIYAVRIFGGMTLHEYLTVEKTAAGLTEAVFAKRIGISQAHVNRLRRGEGWPQKEVMERIRAATGGRVTPNDFLSPLAAK